MRRLFVLLLVVAALICVIGCSNEGAVQMGTLNIEIDSSISRGIEPIPMDIKSYNVTVTNKQSQEEAFSSKADKHEKYSISLPVGTYVIKVEALNKAGEIIGEGSFDECKVEAKSKYETVTIMIKEYEGKGTFKIAIAANPDYTLQYEIKDAEGKTVKDDEDKLVKGDLSYDESKGLYSVTLELKNGFYEFTITDKREDEVEYVLKNDTVRIVTGRIASYEAEFLIRTDGTVIIEKGGVSGTPRISLELKSEVLSTATLKAEESLTVKAEVENIMSGYSYWWTVDGVMHGMKMTDLSKGIELVLGKDEVEKLDPGSHTVALFVQREGVVWSEFKSFTVLSDYPTAIEVKGETEYWFVGDVLIPYDYAVSVKVGGSNYTFNPRSTVHKVDRPDASEVKSVVIQSVSDDNYFAYLDYEYDEVKKKTTVYIKLDKEIEDPGYVVLDLSEQCVMGDAESMGVWFRADKTNFNPAQPESYGHRAFATVINGETERKYKVDPDKYSVASVTDTLKYEIVLDKKANTVKSGETKEFKLDVKKYTTFVKVGVPNISEYPEFNEKVESISFFIGENEVGSWSNGEFPGKEFETTKRLTKFGYDLPVKVELVMKEGQILAFFEYEIVPDTQSLDVEEGNTYGPIKFSVHKKVQN